MDWDICGFARNTGPCETIAVESLNLSALEGLDTFYQRLEKVRADYGMLQRQRRRIRESLSRGDERSFARILASRPPSSASSSAVHPSGSSSSALPYEEISEIQEIWGAEVVPERHELSSRQDALFAAAQHAGLEIPEEAPQGPVRADTLRRRRTTTAAAPTTPATTIINGEGEGVFSGLDERITRFMSGELSLGSAAAAIQTLHSLPGGPRAFLYNLGSSSSDPRRPFRCPFDIMHPRGTQSSSSSCQGPGFYPLSQLW